MSPLLQDPHFDQLVPKRLRVLELGIELVVGMNQPSFKLVHFPYALLSSAGISVTEPDAADTSCERDFLFVNLSG